jgi:hypothetical protein
VEGTVAIAPPNLSVQGLGLLSPRFQQDQVAPLRARAQLAPFGRGEQTVIDTAVRRTWQIDADQITFAGRNWVQTLGGIVGRAADGLGVPEPVNAQALQIADLRYRQLFH